MNEEKKENQETQVVEDLFDSLKEKDISNKEIKSPLQAQKGKNEESDPAENEAVEKEENLEEKEKVGETQDDAADYKKLYDKVKEEAAINSKFSREKSLKLKKIAAEIKRVVDVGLLDDEEGNNLLSILDQKDIGSEEEEKPEIPSDPLLKKLSVVSKSLVDSYLDFSDTTEEEYQKKLKGFSFLLHEMTAAERESMEEEMDSLAVKPVNLLKFVLKKGEDFMKESAYEDFLNNGGFRNLKKKQQEKILELERKLEKAQKELSSYKSEGTGKFKIKENNPVGKITPVGDIFDSFKDRSI